VVPQYVSLKETAGSGGGNFNARDLDSQGGCNAHRQVGSNGCDPFRKLAFQKEAEARIKARKLSHGDEGRLARARGNPKNESFRALSRGFNWNQSFGGSIIESWNPLMRVPRLREGDPVTTMFNP